MVKMGIYFILICLKYKLTTIQPLFVHVFLCMAVNQEVMHLSKWTEIRKIIHCKYPVVQAHT